MPCLAAWFSFAKKQSGLREGDSRHWNFVNTLPKFFSATFVLALMVIGPLPVFAEDAAERLERFALAWKIQQSEIKSARVVVRILDGVAASDMEWTEFLGELDIMQEVEATRTFEEVEQHLIDTAESIYARKLFGKWKQLKILVEGDDILNSSTGRNAGGDYSLHSRYRNGVSTEYMSPFSEFHLEAGRSKIGRHGIGLLRYVLAVEASTLTYAAKQDDVDGAVTLNLTGRENTLVRLTVDDSSSLVRRVEIPQSTAAFYGGIAEYPGGIYVPKYGIRGIFRNGKVFVVWAHVLESAEFNISIPKEEWEITLPKGTRVVDKQDVNAVRVGFSPKEGDPVEIAKITGSLRKQIPPPVAAETEFSAASGFWRMTILIVVNAMLLFVVGILAFRKKGV